MFFNCFQCQQEITAGKFYNFFTGKKGGKRLGPYKGREFFCPPCAENEKANDTIYLENLIKVEWEVGNQTDEQILEFEKKWEYYYLQNEFIKHAENTDKKKSLGDAKLLSKN